jgi:hypothetical protein
MNAIEKVSIKLILPRSPWVWKDELLGVLERHPLLAPTHWGRNERLRERYQRVELEHACEEERRRDDPDMPSLRRTQRPGYDAIWTLGPEVPGWFRLSSRMSPVKPEEAEAYFGLAEQLARVLPIEFGLVHLKPADTPKELQISPGGLEHSSAYQRCGPLKVFPRTFFGRRLVELMGGRDILQESGGVVTQLENGTAMLDLLHAPWRADAASLKKQELAVLEQLRRTEVWAIETEFVDEPGRRWVPIP